MSKLIFLVEISYHDSLLLLLLKMETREAPHVYSMLVIGSAELTLPGHAGSDIKYLFASSVITCYSFAGG